jgi:hypothetical protein
VITFRIICDYIHYLLCLSFSIIHGRVLKGFLYIYSVRQILLWKFFFPQHVQLLEMRIVQGPMFWFFTQTPNFCETFIVALVFEKNANFFFVGNWQKSQKIVIITSTPELRPLGPTFVFLSSGRIQSSTTRIIWQKRWQSSVVNCNIFRHVI